jgi:DNA-binding NarL/FixJ family response regulator
VSDARPHLVVAQRIFAAMGASAWELRTTGELRAAGIRQEPTNTWKDQGLALSPQEKQIARMAAQGLSNREIGQALFLSPRTVGSHLYRIFPKLSVTSRMQLAVALSGTVE